jgi:hypothetical protein
MLETELHKRDVSLNYAKEAKSHWDQHMVNHKAKANLELFKTEIERELVYGKGKDHRCKTIPTVDPLSDRKKSLMEK